MLLLPVAAQTAVGLATWVVYSVVQQQRLAAGTFLGMRLLSELREPNGDKNQYWPELFDKLPTLGEDETNESFKLIDEWSWAAGDQPTGPLRPGTLRISRDNSFACWYDATTQQGGLYTPEPVPTTTLTDHVRGLSDFQIRIVEDLPERACLDRAMAACVPLPKDDPSTAVSCLTAAGGTYSFRYRDYVNQEEMLAMMNQRWGAQQLLMRASRAGQLMVDDDGVCQLVEKGVALGFLPLSITWEGAIEEGEIRWTTSNMRLGWSKLGTTIDKPAAAEKLRVDPWVIQLPEEDNLQGNVVAFQRQGKGCLLYARDSITSTAST